MKKFDKRSKKGTFEQKHNGYFWESLSKKYFKQTFFAVFRNLVREIRFEKSGLRNLVRKKWFCKLVIFFSGSRKVVDQINRWVYTINPPFFRLGKSGSVNSDFFPGSRKVVADQMVQ